MQPARIMTRRPLRRRLVLAVAVLGGVIVAGTVGFILVQPDYRLYPLDALYMTVITIFTVGYREIYDPSAGGQVLTILLIFAGVGTYIVVAATLTAFILEGELGAILRRRRMQREIDRLRDHFIVCGAGDTGRHVVEEFARTQIPFVVVDTSEEAVERLRDDLGTTFAYAVGSALEEPVLENAGVQRARGLVSALPEDRDNLVAVLTARGLNPRLRIVARATAEESRAKLFKVGADAVVSPNHIGGLRMASEMIRPDVVHFLDAMLRDKETTLRVEEAVVREGSAFAGHTIGESDIGKKTGVIIVAIRDAASGEYQFNPPASTRLHLGDILIVIGNLEQVRALRRLAQRKGLATGEQQATASKSGEEPS